MDLHVPGMQEFRDQTPKKSHRRTPYNYNILSNISHTNLLKDARNFAQQHNLADKLSKLQTGALLAQDPSRYAEIAALKAKNPGLYASIYDPTAGDIQALRDELDHPWHHKKQIPRTIILCSIGAAVQGWDQTASNGANIFWPKDLLLHGMDGIPHGKNGVYFGLVNAAPWISAGLLGCWLSDLLGFYIGRRGCIFLGAIFCILPIIGSACVHRWQDLLACRLLLGLGFGLKATSIPVYMAENSPKSIRGALVMTWQMCVALGILLGSLANLVIYNFHKSDSVTWRLQLGAALIPAVPLLLGIYCCPESPRWFIKKRRYQDAYRSLKKLRNTKLQAARDLYYIHKQLTDTSCGTSRSTGRYQNDRTANFNVSQTPQGLKSYLVRLKELFVKNRVRQATIASFTVMIAQQMCGINIFMFYASLIFNNLDKRQGPGPAVTLWCSFGVGLANFLFAFPALYTIDRWGRRTLLLMTLPLLALTLLAAGLCSLIRTEHVKYGAVATFLLIYTAIYSTGEGPVPFTYSAEVFPLSHREIGMGFAVTTNFIFAAMLSVTFPLMLTRFHPVGAMVFYAGLNVIAVVMVFLLVPETQQRTLEDLDHIFDKPVREFARESIHDSIQGLKFHRVKNCENTASPIHTLDPAPKIIRRSTE